MKKYLIPAAIAGATMACAAPSFACHKEYKGPFAFNPSYSGAQYRQIITTDAVYADLRRDARHLAIRQWEDRANDLLRQIERRNNARYDSGLYIR